MRLYCASLGKGRELDCILTACQVGGLPEGSTLHSVPASPSLPEGVVLPVSSIPRAEEIKGLEVQPFSVGFLPLSCPQPGSCEFL